MNRMKLALCSAAALALVLQGPSLAQDEDGEEDDTEQVEPQADDGPEEDAGVQDANSDDEGGDEAGGDAASQDGAGDDGEQSDDAGLALGGAADGDSVDEEEFDLSSIDIDDFDLSIEDDAIDVEDGGDNDADELFFEEDDWGVSFDDADEDGDANGEGIDDDDRDLFQDRLATLRGGEEGTFNGMTQKLVRPVAILLKLISGGTLVRRRPQAFLVRDGQASFQAQVRYKISPRGWGTYPAAVPDWEIQHVCGGALIAPNWVITAAHCVSQGHLDRKLEVRLGEDNIAQAAGGEVLEVDRLVIHGGYSNSNMYRNDIALVHLKVSASSRYVRIPRYTQALPTTGTTFLSTLGWGRRREGGRETEASAALYRADVKLIGETDCKRRPGYDQDTVNRVAISPIDSSVLCGGDTLSKACVGDSGGPVVMTNGAPVLVGIVSWTKRYSCGQPQYPGVYTRIGAFEGWIGRAMAAAPHSSGVTLVR